MLHIRPLERKDIEAIRRFTDLEIGAGYYSAAELEDIFKRSQKNGVMCSLILEDAANIKGIRISYPPENWEHGKGHGLHPERWPYGLRETGYFQSLFVAGDLQGQGWGAKLSRAAIGALRQTGARGVVCHSWKESPNDSSARYLRKLGFELIAEHPNYWRDVDYTCTRCGKPPCTCTSQEMYLDLGRIL